MTIKVAINGYGRIGRMLLRAIYEEKFDDIQVVAINGLGGIDINAHLPIPSQIHGVPPDSKVLGVYRTPDLARLMLLSKLLF
jgi:glyceraldehyde 3-phosphate dehydrogenase